MNENNKNENNKNENEFINLISNFIGKDPASIVGEYAPFRLGDWKISKK